MNQRPKDPSKPISVTPWLHEHMDFLRNEWSTLRDGRLMSFQQFMELVIQFTVDNLKDPDYVRNFQFTTRGRGRPRRSELASPLSETVSEDPLKEEQLHASEDEASPGPHDRATLSGGSAPDHPW